MTQLDLYKFIWGNDIEWRRCDNKGTVDVIIFPNYYHIDGFREILSATDFDDEGIKCHMKDGYFAIWMRDICERNGVDIDKVFLPIVTT